MVRNCRCQTFKGDVAVIFFEYLALEANLIDMLTHIEEVDDDCLAVLVLNFLSSYHRVICDEFRFLCMFIFIFLPILILPLGFVDLTILLIQFFFCLIDHTTHYSVKAELCLYLQIRGVV